MRPRIINLGSYKLGACIAKGHGKETKLSLNSGSIELYIPVMPRKLTFYFWLTEGEA